MQDEWSSPSGSRWEPVPGPAARGAAQAVGVPADAGAPEVRTRRRYRRPVLAVLLTLLGAGTVTAGAAYVQGDAPAAAPTSQVSADDEHDGRHVQDGDGGGHRHGPRSGDDQPLPSGDPS